MRGSGQERIQEKLKASVEYEVRTKATGGTNYNSQEKMVFWGVRERYLKTNLRYLSQHLSA